LYAGASFPNSPLQVLGARKSLFLRRVDPGRGDIGPVEIRMIEDRAAKIGAAGLGLGDNIS